ncbi:MAG: hydrogenase accessory protein HypB, partial [Thermoplasmata archaeon]|nr:hydrogenase accessory protein HypB [Thermoplasmata archaeon]
MHKVVDLEHGVDLLAANKKLADANRALLDKHGVRAFDVLGSIGSGKTLLIEHLIDMLKGKGVRAGAIAGDVAGDD